MDIGFDTVGNATLIVYDREPLLITDPWLDGPAYFGSWNRSHEIPEEQRDACRRARFIWISHGHPDHMCAETLAKLRGRKILVPDHVGGRIAAGLRQEGHDVQVMLDRRWQRLSERVRVQCIADENQDAILLIELNGRLVVNLNDASDRGWGRHVKRTIAAYPLTILTGLEGYGDADMINYFDETGNAIPPLAARRAPIGPTIAARTEAYGAHYFVPSSSMHMYQRTDSAWANKHTTPISDYAIGFQSTRCALLPAYIRFDCATDRWRRLDPPERPIKLVDPKQFGDDWGEELDRGEVAACKRYFERVEHLRTFLDFITLRVGGREHHLELRKARFRCGVTFEVPRGSLMSAIRDEVFDDLLIGNFMKTTLHGRWPESRLYPDFTPYVAKYGDNGQARTRDELSAYRVEYLRRAPLDVVLNRIQRSSMQTFRRFIAPDSGLYRQTRRAYYFLGSSWSRRSTPPPPSAT